ncbi:hypothetical protein D7U77_02925 [Stenotrophomonas maltophilia]|nr:hypothetical protein [Stenotrophomonas maltophilia]
MPNTGQFYVLALVPVRDEHGNIVHVRQISMRCTACGGITDLSGDVLGKIPGGTVLTCNHCGARQAVSNARLDECHHVLPNEPARRNDQ